MGIDRQIISSQLADFLNDKISQNELYNWALDMAVSSDLSALGEMDPLARRVVLALTKLQGAPSRAPSRADLKYYYECLTGQKEFIEAVSRKSRLGAAFALASRVVFAVVLFTLRMYVFIFGLCMFVVNYLLLRDPGIFQSAENLKAFLSFLKGLSSPAFYAFVSDALMRPEFPFLIEMMHPQQAVLQIPLVHLIYAFLILMPPGFVARNIVFTVSFPLLILGVFYYWFLAWDIAARIAFAFVFDRIFACLLLSPITGIPATLALFLLITKTLQLQKKDTVVF